ncbi:MAG: hypothetical protein J6J71_01420 [Prevotella sp.]|nr:hypothetical protein [Prevotella sp.]
MTPKEIKANLGKMVHYKSERLGLDGEFLFTGAIFRKGKSGFYYQAELQTMNGVIYTSLEQIDGKSGTNG